MKTFLYSLLATWLHLSAVIAQTPIVVEPLYINFDIPTGWELISPDSMSYPYDYLLVKKDETYKKVYFSWTRKYDPQSERIFTHLMSKIDSRTKKKTIFYDTGTTQIKYTQIGNYYMKVYVDSMDRENTCQLHIYYNKKYNDVMVRIKRPTTFEEVESFVRSIRLQKVSDIDFIHKKTHQEALDSVRRILGSQNRELFLHTTRPDTVTSLSLSFWGLDTIPKEIKKFENIEVLSLINSQFKLSSQDIVHLSSLKKLRYLSFLENQIKEIPEEIKLLENLEDLDLRNNQIQKIASSFYQLSKIRAIYLENNQLNYIDTMIGNLSNLVYFEIEGNRIKEIPNSILNLPYLESISLPQNMQYVPVGLADKIGNWDLKNYQKLKNYKEFIPYLKENGYFDED